MSRDSGLTVGEETSDLHARNRLPLRRAMSQPRPDQSGPGRHRASEHPVPPRPAAQRWEDTTVIPTEQVVRAASPSDALPTRAPQAALAAEKAMQPSRKDRMVQGFLEALQTIREAASRRGEL